MPLQNRTVKLFFFAIIFAVSLVCSDPIIFAQKTVPRFENCLVTKIYRGTVAQLKLTKRDEAWRERFQWGLKTLKSIMQDITFYILGFVEVSV